MTALRTMTRRARTSHRCDYCGQTIPVGQQYLRWCCLDDWTAVTVTAHIACDTVGAAYYDEVDSYDDERRVCFDALTEWARDREDVAGDLTRLGASWPEGEIARLATTLGCTVGQREATP